MQGVVYHFSCMRCEESHKETCFDKGLEHLSAIERMDVESPLVEHHNEDHPDHDPWFSMKLESVHERPLHTQCEEAHLIDGFRDYKTMNRKGKRGQNCKSLQRGGFWSIGSVPEVIRINRGAGGCMATGKGKLCKVL